MIGQLSIEEVNMICIYSGAGTRMGVIGALESMRGYLGSDEDDLRELPDSTLKKLRGMTDEDYNSLDLYPVFGGPEDIDAE